MTSTIHPLCHRLALASTLLLGAASAAAREPTTVALYTSTCSPREDAALRRALEVELRAMEVEPRFGAADASGAPARFTLRAECDADDQSVALRLWSNEPELVLARRVALRDVAAPARARTLALVISEAIAPALAGGAMPAGGDRSSRSAAPSTAATSSTAPPAAGAGTHRAASPRVASAASSFPSERETRSTPRASSHIATDGSNPQARSRSRRTSRLTRTNPYGELDELYSTSNPYGMPHAFRISTGAQGRVASRDSSVLLGLELGMSGPLSENADWAIEISNSSSTAWGSELDASWWSASLGLDFVNLNSIGLAFGPRLSFGHLDISDPDPRGFDSDDAGPERTLVTQLGLRSKLDVPVGERISMQMTFSGHHTVGVYALTRYTGLDEGLNGWVLSWGLGLGIEP